MGDGWVPSDGDAAACNVKEFKGGWRARNICSLIYFEHLNIIHQIEYLSFSWGQRECQG